MLLRLPDIWARDLPNTDTATTIGGVTTVQQPTLSPALTSVATEVLLLQPRGENERTGLWPLFVMVITEPAGKTGLPLFELLDRHRRGDEPTVVAVESSWSVLDTAGALLAMTVRATEPVPVDLRIVLPASSVLDILDMVARGAPIGVTTLSRAEGLHGRVDLRTAMRDVVLLSCPPSVDLSHLARLLRMAREV